MIKVFKACLLFFISILGSCQTNSKYYISIPPNYEGWIYLIKSRGQLITDTLHANTNGIVYVPSLIFLKSSSFEIVDRDKVVGKGLYNVFHSVFYDEKNQQTTYSHFFFPFTISKKEQKVYELRGEPMREFEYYYYTGIIDTSQIYR